MRFLPYGFLATGSPRLTAFLAPLSPAKLPVSYPFFLSSPCTDFDPTDVCHLRRRFNLLICLFAIFGLNDNVVLFCFNSVTSSMEPKKKSKKKRTIVLEHPAVGTPGSTSKTLDYQAKGIQTMVDWIGANLGGMARRFKSEDFFCRQAARVRLPGRSPFSLLILHERDKSNVARKTKTKGQTNERISHTNSKQINPRRSSGSKTRGAFRSQWRQLQQHLETKGPGWYPLAEREGGFLVTGQIGLEMM